MIQLFRKESRRKDDNYYCAHRPVVGKSMKGYSWEYFEQYVLPKDLKRNPYKFYYYVIEGSDIHPNFWKNDTSSVLRVIKFEEIEISKEMRHLT